MIAPAPRKPTPVTICAAMRVGSKTIPSLLEKCQSVQPYAETSVNSAAPSETSRCVRNPASRSRSSRSTPIAAPRPAASPSRSASSANVSSGMHGLGGRPLRRRDLVDTLRAEREHLVQVVAREGGALGRRLHLDQPAAPGHHDVEVDLGARVLDIVEIEQRLAVDDPDGDRADGVDQRAAEPHVVERALRGDVYAGDAGAASPSVGLKDVAVEPERALAERLHVRNGPHGAADQALDLDRAALLLALAGLARRALAGGGGQH